MFVAPEWITTHCVVPDGFRAGAPFKPYTFQFEYYCNFYLVRGDAPWIPENPIKAPAFVYRRGLMVGPQGVGKNPAIAAQICLEGVGPALFAGFAEAGDAYICAEHGCPCGWRYEYGIGEPKGMPWPTPLIQITAVSQASTDNTYDALRPMIDDGPLADVIPHTGEEFIRLPGGGRIDTVTSSAQSRLGQRLTFAPQDEVGLYTTRNKMRRVAKTQWRGLSKMGGRASMTTNAWDPGEDSIAKEQFESGELDVLRYYVAPPAGLHYGDRRERRRIHRAVYPADTLAENGGHVDLDAIEAEASELAKLDPAEARRFYGNELVAGAGDAVDPDRWDELGKPDPGRHPWFREPGDQPPAGSRIGAGFDGSIYVDATVIRGSFQGRTFEWGVWEKPEGAELTRWLRAHPGKDRWEVDRLEVEEAVTRLFATYDVGLMLCDTPKWKTEIEAWARQYALGPRPEDQRVVAFDTNQTVKFAPAVDRWLTGIATGDHTHDAATITDRHVKAVQKKKVHLADDPTDGRTMYVLVKGADNERIDGAVTDVLAYVAEQIMPAAKPGSVYEERGFLVLRLELTCPDCGNETLLGRDDRDGWRCDLRLGGCNHTFDLDDPRIREQLEEVDDVPPSPDDRE
jgi:hypothetical protein